MPAAWRRFFSQDWPLSQGWGLVVSSDEALRELVIVNIQESTSVKHWNLEHPE